MHVHITCKYQKDRIKNNQESGDTIFPFISICFFRRSRADNSVVCGSNWPKFELILDIFMSLWNGLDQ